MLRSYDDILGSILYLRTKEALFLPEWVTVTQFSSFWVNNVKIPKWLDNCNLLFKIYTANIFFKFYTILPYFCHQNTMQNFKIFKKYLNVSLILWLNYLHHFYYFIIILTTLTNSTLPPLCTLHPFRPATVVCHPNSLADS